jgi:hypothetical protein
MNTKILLLPFLLILLALGCTSEESEDALLVETSNSTFLSLEEDTTQPDVNTLDDNGTPDFQSR